MQVVTINERYGLKTKFVIKTSVVYNYIYIYELVCTHLIFVFLLKAKSSVCKKKIILLYRF